jgi:hypothetical protein
MFFPGGRLGSLFIPFLNQSAIFIGSVVGQAMHCRAFAMTNEDCDIVSFARQAERAVFQPDRGSGPTMSPAGGGRGAIAISLSAR